MECKAAKLEVGDDLVVIIHGYLANRLVMRPLEKRLSQAGFRTRQWAYPSFFSAVETHAENFFQFLASELAQEPRVHIVAHSMGTIITRAALKRGTLANLGRVVLLAPPNQGSPFARFLATFLGWISKPAVDLSSRDGSYVKQLDQSMPVDCGVIAARFDLLVPIASTHFAGETAHAVVNHEHLSLLYSKSVCRMVASFLREGNFGR